MKRRIVYKIEANAIERKYEQNDRESSETLEEEDSNFSDYQIQEEGSDSCVVDLTYHECAALARKERYEFVHEEVENYPKGCYLHCSSRVYFNRHTTGSTHIIYSAPICKDTQNAARRAESTSLARDILQKTYNAYESTGDKNEEESEHEDSKEIVAKTLLKSTLMDIGKDDAFEEDDNQNIHYITEVRDEIEEGKYYVISNDEYYNQIDDNYRDEIEEEEYDIMTSDKYYNKLDHNYRDETEEEEYTDEIERESDQNDGESSEKVEDQDSEEKEEESFKTRKE